MLATASSGSVTAAMATTVASGSPAISHSASGSRAAYSAAAATVLIAVEATKAVVITLRRSASCPSR